MGKSNEENRMGKIEREKLIGQSIAIEHIIQ